MTEDQIDALTGDASLGQAVFWVIAAGVLIALAIRAWPSVKKFIATLDALVTLPETLAKQGETLAKQGKEIEKVRAQVQNSHDTNLRDELDERHQKTQDTLVGIAKDVGRLDARDLTRTQHDNHIAKKLDSVDTKLDDHLLNTVGNVNRISDLERAIEVWKAKP